MPETTSTGDRICACLEYLRWVLVAVGLWLAYDAASTDPASGVRLMVPFLVGGICGLTGLESILFGAAAARRTGYVRSEYQIQSGMNNLALAAIAMVAFLANWGNAAYVALLSVMLLFLMLSAVNHFIGWRGSNASLRGLRRPALTIVLVLAVLPLLLKSLP